MKSSSPSGREIRRVAVASAIGSAIEWYDYFLYAEMAGLVLNKLFFPRPFPVLGTLVVYAAFAGGLIARPIGGIVWGHFGDRLGRKPTFVVTLLMMGIATCLIGLLPTYETAGVAATILLFILRVVQGFALGGEWGGASLMAVEHAPRGQRGFYGSWPQVGVPIGVTAATITIGLLSMSSDEALSEWGWRVAFLLSGFLVVIGLYIRWKILETPLFERLDRTQAQAAWPFVELWRTHAIKTTLATGCLFVEAITLAIFGVYAMGFLTSELRTDRVVSLIAISIISLIMVVLIPVFGGLSDRYGSRRIFALGVVGTALFAYPSFWLMGTREISLVVLAIGVSFGIVYPMMCGPLAAMVSELFKTRVRYTGVSFAYQFSGIFGSTLALSIAAALPRFNDGRPSQLVGYIAATAIVSLICLGCLGLSTGNDIAEV